MKTSRTTTGIPSSQWNESENARVAEGESLYVHKSCDLRQIVECGVCVWMFVRTHRHKIIVKHFYSHLTQLNWRRRKEKSKKKKKFRKAIACRPKRYNSAKTAPNRMKEINKQINHLQLISVYICRTSYCRSCGTFTADPVTVCRTLLCVPLLCQLNNNVPLVRISIYGFSFFHFVLLDDFFSRHHMRILRIKLQSSLHIVSTCNK